MLEWQKPKIQTISSDGKDAEKLELSYTVGEEPKWYIAALENSANRWSVS